MTMFLVSLACPPSLFPFPSFTPLIHGAGVYRLPAAAAAAVVARMRVGVMGMGIWLSTLR